MIVGTAFSPASPSIWSFSSASQIAAQFGSRTSSRTVPVSTADDAEADLSNISSTVSLAPADVATLIGIYGPNDLAQVEASPVACRLAEQINGQRAVQTGGKTVPQPAASDQVTLTGSIETIPGDRSVIGVPDVAPDPTSTASGSTVRADDTPGGSIEITGAVAPASGQPTPELRQLSPGVAKAISALLQTATDLLDPTLRYAA